MRNAGAVARAAGAAILMLCAGCAVGPDYKRPDAPLAVSWQLEQPWHVSEPADTLAKGAWWQRFNDATLDDLEQQALANSPTLAGAAARLAQARAVLSATGSALVPQVNLGLRAQRFGITENRPLTNYNSPNFSTTQNDFATALSVNYELDLFGRIRRSVEGARASAQQVAADYENARLLLTTDLASAYFNLREIDSELDVVRRSIDLQRRALDFVTQRHDLGATSGLDVSQQQALLDSTLVQVDVLARQRAQFEHAIAALTGAPAPTFSLAVEMRDRAPPAIPLGVPSDLLQRRPDVAGAERAMAAANAQIGVATAAFYPGIVLGPSIGFQSRGLGSLFDAASLVWSAGVSATQVLFDAGRLNANLDFAHAGYDVQVANYRRTVLGAMQEVEDGITSLASLERAATQAGTAVGSANHVLDMANARYEGGATTYYDVIAAQQGVLTSERQAVQLLGQRMLTSVFLVKALGGDWQGADSLADAQAATAPR